LAVGAAVGAGVVAGVGVDGMDGVPDVLEVDAESFVIHPSGNPVPLTAVARVAEPEFSSVQPEPGDPDSI